MTDQSNTPHIRVKIVGNHPWAGHTGTVVRAASPANCPRCGHRSHTPADGKDQWYCHHCRMIFESIDDGLIGYKGPERNAELSEQRRRYEQAKKATKTRQSLRGGLGR